MANTPTFFLILDNIFRKKTVTPAQARKLLKESSDKVLEPLYNPDATPIYIGSTIRGRFIKVHTGLKVKPIEWDFNKKEYKRKNSDWYENNNFLSSKLSEIRRRFLNMRLESDDLTHQQVKEMMMQVLKGKTTEIEVIDFYEVFDQFLIEKAKISQPGTLQKYTILRKHLKDFEKAYYKLSFEKINKQFDIDFKYWSVNVKKHLNNSISRNTKCIKVYMKWAHEQKFHNSLEFAKLKANNDEGTIVALTYEEFTKIANLDLSDNLKLDRVRDIFIFQCLVGQRFSDLSNLKVKNILHNSNGYFWEVYQIKGSKRNSIMIPLLDKAVEIVEKYKKENAQPEDLVLPMISITNMNVYLKELGKTAQLNDLQNKVNYSGLNRVEKATKKWEVLSSHTARRSFVTLSLQMGMRPEVVRAITGHTTGKMLERYTSISENIKTSEMKEAWGKGF
jgi:integrase